MLKRLILALSLVMGLSPAFGAGTIPFSLSQQLDNLGRPLAACKLYTIQAGTTSTPQNAYQDSALTLVLPNPQICDSAGRLPQMFLADGTVKVRLTDRNGVQQVVADNIQVTGASSGGGGGGTVDPTTILSTGDLKATYGTGVLSGFVRANGRTIGSSTSGASERANADCQALFEYLWSADANLVVSTGRGASANADWVANKVISLPDWRGQGIGALADMGNSATTVLTTTYCGSDPTVLGTACGVQSKTLGTTNLPAYTPAGTFAGSAATINSTLSGTVTVTAANVIPNSSVWASQQSGSGSGVVAGTGGGVIQYQQQLSSGPLSTGAASASYTPAGTFTGTAQGGASTPFATTGLLKLATVYIKL